MTFDDAINWVGSSNSKDFDANLQLLLNHQTENKDLHTLFRPIRDYCNSILELCLSSAIETEMLPDKFSGMNYAENKKIKDLIKNGREVNSLVDSDQLLWHVLLEGRTKRELVIYQRLLREINFPNKNWQAVQGNKEYFWALSEGSHWLLSTLDKYIDQ